MSLPSTDQFIPRRHGLPRQPNHRRSRHGDDPGAFGQSHFPNPPGDRPSMLAVAVGDAEKTGPEIAVDTFGRFQNNPARLKADLSRRSGVKAFEKRRCRWCRHDGSRRFSSVRRYVRLLQSCLRFRWFFLSATGRVVIEGPSLWLPESCPSAFWPRFLR